MMKSEEESKWEWDVCVCVSVSSGKTKRSTWSLVGERSKLDWSKTTGNGTAVPV